MVNVQLCLHIDDYTDEEVEQCWYSQDETEDLHHGARQIIQLHKAPPIDSTFLKNDIDGKYCARGLELHIREASFVKLDQNKRKARRMVLQEQYFEFTDEDEEEEYDPSYWERKAEKEIELAQRYELATIDNKKAAYMRGVHDALDAESVWENKENTPAVQRAAKGRPLRNGSSGASTVLHLDTELSHLMSDLFCQAA